MSKGGGACFCFSYFFNCGSGLWMCFCFLLGFDSIELGVFIGHIHIMVQ